MKNNNEKYALKCPYGTDICLLIIFIKIQFMTVESNNKNVKHVFYGFPSLLSKFAKLTCLLIYM